MQWEFILVLIIAIPIILFPAAFVWYTNISGIYLAIKKARRKRAALKKGDLMESERVPLPWM